MKYIIVDLEMNPIAKTYSKKGIFGRETIQIGAVALNEEFKIIDSFSTLVRPEYNDVIDPEIRELTKIDTKMVRDSQNFESAVHSFLAWCNSFGDEIEIQQWSDADQDQLTREISMKKVVLSESEESAMEEWMDFQKEFGETLGLSGQVSLKDAIMYAGIDMIGHQHNALSDARNTARLFTMVRNRDDYKSALGNVIRALKPKPMGCTLGDLFNLNELAVS